MGAKKFEAKLIEKKNLTADYWWLRWELGEEFEYKAGQYVSMKVSDKGERRSYSIASWEKGKLELLIDISPMGVGSKFVLGLEVGEKVEFMGPMGEFVLKNGDSEKEGEGLLFVGTGCGVVPLRAMIHDLLEKRGERRPVKLSWGMRKREEVFWRQDLERLAEKYDNFGLDIVLSRDEEEGFCVGHVQDCIGKHSESWEGWEAYVCGNKQMIEEVRELLVKKGVEGDRVYFERFY